jgi:hypothetical protein
VVLVFNDITCFIMMLYMAIINNRNLLFYLPPIFVWFMLIFTVEMEVVRKLRNAHFLEEAPFFYYFNLLLFAYVVSLFYLFAWPPFSCLGALVPAGQIVHNVQRGTSPHLAREFTLLLLLKLL